MTRYELLERIGVGGMAEIYRGVATAVGGFEKPVAIKKILPHLSRDGRFVQMLIAEAKLLSNLRHRNIVNIYDVGLGDDGQYFLVMEFVDGRDLGALYDRMETSHGRFPPDLALYIGSEVCDALDHAHKATGDDGRPLGIVHRDISPSNVLLSYAGEVKLTDFGIAKPADEKSVVATIKGKFAYMSPEQAWARPLDQTSDLFSLGIVLYELLLGRRMFSNLDEMGALKAVREGRFPKPREVEPSFSRDLEAILLKALSPHPKQRYASAAQMGAALRDYRYSAATSGGDPAKEIATLVRRVFPKKGDPQPTERSTVVRIKTVAGFPSRTGLEGDLGSMVHEAPTVAAPAARPQRPPPPPADDRLARLLGASADVAVEDAATKILDTKGGAGRRGEPTPTVRDAFPSAFGSGTFGAAMPDTGLVTPLPVVMDDRARRPWVLPVVLVLVAALGAVVAFAVVSSNDDAGAEPKVIEPSTKAGEALDTPTVKPPVKRK